MKRCVILVLACLIAVGALCGCGARQPDTSLPKLLIGSDTYSAEVRTNISRVGGQRMQNGCVG